MEARLEPPRRPVIGYLILDNMDDADYAVRTLYGRLDGNGLGNLAAAVIDTTAEAHLPLSERTHGRTLITRCEDHELIISNLDVLGSSPGHVAEAVQALWNAKVNVHIAQFAAAWSSPFTLRPTAHFTRNTDPKAMTAPHHRDSRRASPQQRRPDRQAGSRCEGGSRSYRQTSDGGKFGAQTQGRRSRSYRYREGAQRRRVQAKSVGIVEPQQRSEHDDRH